VTKQVVLLLQYFTYLHGTSFGIYFWYSVLIVRKDETISAIALFAVWSRWKGQAVSGDAGSATVKRS